MKFLLWTLITGSLLFSNCESSKNATHDSADEMKNAATEVAENQEASEETSEDAVYRMKNASKEIIGTWEWVKTDCCGRMKSTKEADPKEEKHLISFSADGTATYYMAGQGSRIDKQKYSLSAMGTQPTVKIGELQPAIFFIKDDMLILNWEYMDLQIEYYKRYTKKY